MQTYIYRCGYQALGETVIIYSLSCAFTALTSSATCEKNEKEGKEELAFILSPKFEFVLKEFCITLSADRMREWMYEIAEEKYGREHD